VLGPVREQLLLADCRGGRSGAEPRHAPLRGRPSPWPSPRVPERRADSRVCPSLTPANLDPPRAGYGSTSQACQGRAARAEFPVNILTAMHAGLGRTKTSPEEVSDAQTRSRSSCSPAASRCSPRRPSRLYRPRCARGPRRDPGVVSLHREPRPARELRRARGEGAPSPAAARRQLQGQGRPLRGPLDVRQEGRLRHLLRLRPGHCTNGLCDDGVTTCTDSSECAAVLRRCSTEVRPSKCAGAPRARRPARPVVVGSGQLLRRRAAPWSNRSNERAVRRSRGAL
jgi:hypothetical protein